MGDGQLFCDVVDCDDPENPGFARPAFRYGKCSTHAKQLQRTGKTSAIAEKLPLNEQLIDAYSRYAEADSDEDEARFKRNFFSLAKKVGQREMGQAIKEAMQRRKAAGKPVGRPPKVDTDEVIRHLRVVGRTDLVARLLGVNRATVYRHLERAERRQIRKKKPSAKRAG